MSDKYQISLSAGNNKYIEDHYFFSASNIKDFYGKMTFSRLNEIRLLVYKNALVLNKIDDLSYKKIKAIIYNSLGQKRVVYLPKIKNTVSESELRQHILDYMFVKDLRVIRVDFVLN